MFGLLRFILASIVVLNHIAGMPDYAAHYSVWGFYTVSGFLMTLILKDKYSLVPGGMMKFIINRFLRIFPTYWFSIVLSVALIFVIDKEIIRTFHSAIRLPINVQETLSNIFIFGLMPNVDMARLTPPSWALNIELIYYVLMGLIFYRSFKLNLVWFLLSLGYTMYFTLYEGTNVYNDIIACGLPFSAGALCYFGYKKVKALNYISTYVVLIMSFFLFIVFVLISKTNPYGLDLIVVPFIFVVMVVLPLK